MKIGIFADSHADCSYMDWSYNAPDVGPGWPELLAKFHRVKNYAEGGSGLWFSFQRFLKCNQEFDYNIFIPSQYSRFTLTLPERGATFHVVPGFVSGDRLRKEHKRDNTLIDNQIIEAAAGYIDHLIDYDKDIYIASLLIEQIHRINPNTLIVYAFNNTNPDRYFLSDLTLNELSYWGTSVEKVRKENPNLCDLRKCHLSDENNEMVFRKISNAIKQRQQHLYFTKDDLIKPKKPFSTYFKHLQGRSGNV